MKKRFTEEEVALIKSSYRTMGPEYLAARLGRSKGSVTSKAFLLGVTKPINAAPRKKRRAKPQEQPPMPDSALPRKKYVKTDNLQNFDPEGVKRAMQAEAAASADRVMLRINRYTWVQVPRHLATPEYAEQVRTRLERNNGGNAADEKAKSII